MVVQIEIKVVREYAVGFLPEYTSVDVTISVFTQVPVRVAQLDPAQEERKHPCGYRISGTDAVCRHTTVTQTILTCTIPRFMTPFATIMPDRLPY